MDGYAQIISLSLAVTVVGIAVYTDARSRVISNRLTLPAMICGVLLQGLTRGPEGLVYALQGAVLGLLVLLIPVLLGGMGAGDAKLLAAVGSLAGPGITGGTFFFSVLLAGGLGLWFYFARGWRKGLPYAPCILLGLVITLVAVFAQRSGQPWGLY